MHVTVNTILRRFGKRPEPKETAFGVLAEPDPREYALVHRILICHTI